MKDKVLLGILIILVVVSAICVEVNSSDVNQIKKETNVIVSEVKEEALEEKTKNTLNLIKDEYITEDELIYSNKYLIKGKTIYRIAPKTTIEEFIKNIEISKRKEIKICKGEKEITSGYIGTGMLVKEEDGQEYTTSVTGDIKGDGIANQVELTMMIRHLIDLKGWQLEGIEKDSADITGDGKVNLVDINKLINYIVYEEWEEEEISVPKEPTIRVITKKDENKDYYIGAVEIKIEEDKSTKNSKTTYIITGTKQQKETEIKEGEIITLSGEGEYLITAYTYGIKGNKSKGANKVIKLKDPTPNLTEGNTIITRTPTEWTRGPVTVKIETKIEGYTLQYSKDGVKWEDYTKEIEIEQNGKIYARLRDDLGNVGNNVVGNIENIDKVAPIVLLAPNGGVNYTMPSTGNAKINTTITATDSAKTDINGCSGLNILQYAWSQSKYIEPDTWIDFTNGTKVEKTDITTPGTWYLWTKVIDRAGNRAENVKVSNPFIITSNTDIANQITLTPNKTTWTKENVTVTANFGANLVQAKTLVCTGTVGTDYTVNGTESVVVKTNGKTVTAIARDAAGNTVGKELRIDNIDKLAPTVVLVPNGGANYIMPVEGKAKISTTLTAKDVGGSNLNTLQYAWSQSNTQEPTAWMTFANGSTISKIDISSSGIWYLWTKVTDKAGNRAESVKVSNPFIVKPNTDEANQITLTQNPKLWTNGNVTVTVNFGANLVKDKTLVCTGTVGTDYTVNGVSSIVVKTNEKTITCAAKDIEGNIVSKTLTISNIDKTIPTMNSLTANPATWTNGNVTLTGKAIDNQSGIVAYQFSQASNLTATSSGWTSITATKAQTIQTKEVSATGTWYFYVKDGAGNINKNSVAVKIDKTAPTMDSLTANPAVYANRNVTLTGKATDRQSGIVAYQFSKINDLTATSGGWTQVTVATTQITQTKEVSETGIWYFYVKDVAGNINKKQIAIIIDKTAPTITVPDSIIAGNVINAEVEDLDSGVNYWAYSTTSATPTTWTSITNIKSGTIPITINNEGTYYIFVKDAAGNVSSASITVIPARWSNVRDKTNYTTLEDALLVANSGDTLRLLSNYDDDSEAVISLNKTITLDTNGKTLTKSINTIRIDEGSTLNLNGTGTINSTSSSISIFSNLGTLNINGGTINSDYNVVWNQGNIKMSGGTLISGRESTDEYGTPGMIVEEGNVNISGGSISCGGIAIELRGNANITITGESTVVRGGTCSRWSSIYCTDTASGTITIGTSSSSSNTYPYITSEFGGIDNESTNVRVTRYSGKVD